MDGGLRMVWGGRDNECMVVEVGRKYGDLRGKVGEKGLVGGEMSVKKKMVGLESGCGLER